MTTRPSDPAAPPAASKPAPTPTTTPAAASAPTPASKSAPARNVPQRPEGPRKVRHGIRVRSREEVPAKNWIVEEWLARVNRTWDAATRVEAFEYGRLGQTRSLDIQAGYVTAQVQGRKATPYDVHLDFEPLNATQWEEFIATMAANGMVSAQLFSEELPAAEILTSIAAEANVRLLPHETIQVTCTCAVGQTGAPCKHGATIALLMAERLNADPLLLFTMRGLAASVLIDRIRRARTIRTHGVASAHAEPFIPETQDTPTPLELCIDEFWRPGPRVQQVDKTEPVTYADHALLRRLGPSPMKGRFPLVGLLASIYDAVAEQAAQMQDRVSDGNGNGNGTTE
ncbi:MAG: hypothetical protein AAF432_12955 [Planctomycetota bacterium]